jgi:hypothetical protein
MVTPAGVSIDLFKIAGRSFQGRFRASKRGIAVRQPFCSQLEERILAWLECHPQVVSSARGDIGPRFCNDLQTAHFQQVPPNWHARGCLKDVAEKYRPDGSTNRATGKTVHIRFKSIPNPQN